MPDFDTHTPQEPDQPSTHTSMTRRLGLGLSFVLLTVLAGVGIAFWAVLGTADHPRGTPGDVLLDIPTDQLDQEIQLKPPPAYGIVEYDEGSSAFSCEPEVLGYPSRCFIVSTETTSATKLASIVEDIITDPVWLDPAYLDDAGNDFLLRVDFHEESEIDPRAGATIATSYCFVHKSVAVSALGSALKDAELLGKTDNCYLALYREPFADEELLKPSH